MSTRMLHVVVTFSIILSTSTFAEVTFLVVVGCCGVDAIKPQP